MNFLGVPIVLLAVIAAALAVVRPSFLKYFAGLKTLFILYQTCLSRLSLSTSCLSVLSSVLDCSSAFIYVYEAPGPRSNCNNFLRRA